ncbi:CDGSH iron-sulfur domain-containing protein [Acidianus infernus]|uniref:CDGSH iron-sulfur domain-containing protein n=1 Tax=Acidianus infernus TaxID=12915 RepID=A0A6A9QCF8_ACIIN|nr:CDGSH iron-sulfur domain-containing protein [Acidianus infernus]MCY0883571.1 CDGSH iron-sulfur domain-containing protein [Acidianus infernus]MUM63774.1 CDGSH iron-sulfur domain-containing protein [Acidianus infernus]
MARLVKHDRNRPYMIKADNGQVFYICACGLSRNKPFCDGSHKRTLDEEEGSVYVYDENGRIKLQNFYP